MPDQRVALAGLLKHAAKELESTVRGDSMGTTLPPDTRIKIFCADSGVYPDGVVVAFLAGDTLVGHRVVGRSRDLRGRVALITRGDASVFCDPPIDPCSILGEVTSRESGSRWQAVPPPTLPGWPSRIAATIVLAAVRTLARLDRDFASRTIGTLMAGVRHIRRSYGERRIA